MCVEMMLLVHETVSILLRELQIVSNHWIYVNHNEQHLLKIKEK